MRTQYQQHHLRLARLGWTAVVLLFASLFITNAPFIVLDTRRDWQLSESLRTAFRFFPTISDFVRYVVTLKVISVVLFVGTAVYLAWQRWDDTMALFTSATLLMTSFSFIFQGDVSRWRYPWPLSAVEPLAATLVPGLFISCFMLLFHLFPDGRFVPRWNRWMGWLAVLVGFLFFGLEQLPFAWSEQFSQFLEVYTWYTFIFLFVLIIVAGLVGQIIKYRRLATNTQRQQTRLVLFALALQLSIIFLSGLIDLVADPSLNQFITLHLGLLLPTLLPLAIGISMLRYRLWDAEKVVTRVLVYGLLTALIAGLYVLVVGGLGTLLTQSTSQGLTILVIGLSAVLFQPARLWLQSWLNRLMYGQRDDPLTVLAEMGKRLEDAAVPSETLPALVETIAQTLKLPYVAVAHTKEEEIKIIASVGEAGDLPLQTFPLVYQSTTIGQLLVAPRSIGEAFTQAEMRLLQNVARQAGTAVYAARLTTDLQRSREQLVTAREEERRRLRRDLHDGLGPQLATLNLKLDAARNQLAYNPAASDDLLAELKGDLQIAIGNIRRVAHDLRPPALDQLGLVSAIREYAAQSSVNGLVISVTAPDPFSPLPAAVEVAAYRIALEAMTNCVRHAGARSCTVSLHVGTSLAMEILDDGCGLPVDYRAGVGLASMRERAAELGGAFHVASVGSGGTAVTVQLPVAQP